MKMMSDEALKKLESRAYWHGWLVATAAAIVSVLLAKFLKHE